MINILVILLAFLRLQFLASSSNQTFLFGYTREPNNYGIKYKHTLHNLLRTFSSQSTDTGFLNATSFSQSPNNNLYGLYMCRGDIDRELCRVCVKYAKDNILASRAYGKEATVWYEHCMLRYSIEPFFGQLNLNSTLATWSLDYTTGNRIRFMRILWSTMNFLAVQAANGREGKKFASKVVKFTEDETLYALVQCTPDLTVNDCRKCLATSIRQVHKMGAKKGGSVIRVNCMVRFETFPFFYSGKIKPFQSPAQTAINSTEIRLRVHMDRLALYNNSINSSTSSLPSPFEVKSPTKIMCRVQVENSTIKAKFSFPSMVVANSTLVKQNGSKIGATSE